MSKSRISGNSEDFGNAGLPKKLKSIGFPPADFASKKQNKNYVFKKTRIYQLGADVPSDEVIVDERTDNAGGG